MRAVWWRRAIERRLSALVLMALALWGATAVATGSLLGRRIRQTIVAERTSHARQIAARIEHELEDELRRLDAIAAILERSGDPAFLGAAVRDLRLADAALRLGRSGEVRWARSVRYGDLVAPLLAAVPPNGPGTWRAQPTDLLATARGNRALLLLPAREADIEGGAVAAAIPPHTGVLASLVGAYRDEPFVVSLLDAHGGLIATSRRGPPIPEPLLATAPVPRTSWIVQLGQSRAEALAAIDTLQRILVGGALTLTAAAVLLAWGAARSIRVPVERLTAAAEGLAAGALDRPIASAGHDEIGRLAHALERLRVALQDDERRSLLLRRVLAAQEDERRRIARELHDETTQQLTALALQLDTAARASAPVDLAATRQLVNTMIDRVHRVIYDLRPSVLDDLGLTAAIRAFARANLESQGIAIHCELPEAVPPLSPEATTAIYRVVQEALTNVVRHARAEAVQVACAVTGDTLTIEVEDDGIGFDPEAMRNPRATGQGLGLLGMRERLALLGGRLAIDAAAGCGTRVTVSVPFTAAGVAVGEAPV